MSQGPRAPRPPGAEIEVATWPPLTVVDVGGWRVGLSGGFTRRANSVVAAGTPEDVDAALEGVEALFASIGAPPVFRVDQGVRPAGLDAVLAARGYRLLARTDVMVAGTAAAAGLGRAAGRPGQPGLRLGVTAEPTSAWLGTWLGLRGGAPVDPGTAERVLAGCTALYLDARHGTGVVGVVRAALQGDWVGLSCLSVDPRARRRGVGRALITRALELAADRGARQAFLQVERPNPEAVPLYSVLGFRTADRYHYRRRS